MAGERASFSTSDLRQVDEMVWELPATLRADMRVPARVFADAELLRAIADALDCPIPPFLKA